MKIILVAVSSLDGKITRGEESDISSWTSPEDKKLFSSLLRKSRLIVMGRKTYEAARPYLKLDLNTLRIVLTRNPENFSGESISGKLEFTNEPPDELVAGLKEKGYNEMLLVGGGEINSLFLKSSLVDEISVTIEPFIFGAGTPLFSREQFQKKLQLISSQKLNEQGTLHLVYRILK